MDDFDRYLSTIGISLMPESFKCQEGSTLPAVLKTEGDFTAPRGSFFLVSLMVTLPQNGTLLLEERPHFSCRYPVEDHMVLRAQMTLNTLSGKMHLIDMVEDDDGIKKGDVVLESGAMQVNAWQGRQMIALIPVPKDTPPGVYTGKIRFYAHSMFYDERLAREISLRLTVQKTCLPSPSKGKFYLNLWQHIFNIARQHEVRFFSDEHLSLLRPYAKALGNLGNKAITVLLSDIPWCGQRCYQEQYQPSDLYEYNFIRIRRKENGEFSYDFSFAEKYIALMEEYGASDIMFTGLYGIWTDEKEGFSCIVQDWADAIRVSYIDEKDGCLRFMRKREEIEAYLRALYRWMKEKVYLSHAYLMGDEVDLPGKTEGWTKVLSTLKALLPDLPRDWDMRPCVLMSDTYRDERVDIYTPALDTFAKETPKMQKAALDRVSKNGKKLWSVCCYPSVMNSFLYTHLNEVRLHGFMTAFLRMDGFIRWNFTVWPSNPRESLRFFQPGWPAGDTCFVYPGKGGQCLLSLRYLALRRGIEDYELCRMTEEKVPDGEKIVQEALWKVILEKDLAKWDFDDYFGREKYMSLAPEKYLSARKILLDALEKEE